MKSSRLRGPLDAYLFLHENILSSDRSRYQDHS